jgi:hypothetical protein
VVGLNRHMFLWLVNGSTLFPPHGLCVLALCPHINQYKNRAMVERPERLNETRVLRPNQLACIPTASHVDRSPPLYIRTLILDEPLIELLALLQVTILLCDVSSYYCTSRMERMVMGSVPSHVLHFRMFRMCLRMRP